MSSIPPPGAAGPSPRSAGPARWTPVRSTVRALLWLMLAVWLVLFVGWLSLHWLILPHIEEWRPTDRSARQRACSARRSASAPSARSRAAGCRRSSCATSRVLDAEQRVALTLPRVFAALSPRSLLALEPRFAQLLIDGASLDVRRDKSGRIRVAGLDFASAQGGADDDAAADWFFRQHEFVIRAGTLRWIDEARDRRAARARRRRARRPQRPARPRRPPRRDAAAGLGRPLQRARPLRRSRCSRAAATGGAGAAGSTPTCRAPS